MARLAGNGDSPVARDSQLAPIQAKASPLGDQVLKIVVLGLTLLYFFGASFFVQTTHITIGAREIFRYSLTGVLIAFGYNTIPAGAAWYLWRKKDRIAAAIFALVIVANCVLVMPQLFMERTELTPTHLIHRREPPHTRYNADISLADIVSVVRERDPVYGFSSEPTWNVGYRLTLRDARTIVLPANTVLTAASPTIDARLCQLGVPISQMDSSR